jgi:transcriptional regulator with XRE-family HTH domain
MDGVGWTTALTMVVAVIVWEIARFVVGLVTRRLGPFARRLRAAWQIATSEGEVDTLGIDVTELAKAPEEPDEVHVVEQVAEVTRSDHWETVPIDEPDEDELDEDEPDEAPDPYTEPSEDEYADRKVKLDPACVRIAREERGLSQKEAAHKFGRSSAWWSVMEATRPSPAQARASTAVGQAYAHDVRLMAGMLNVRQEDLLANGGRPLTLDRLPELHRHEEDAGMRWMDGARLRRLRHRHNKTQRQIAEAMGVSPSVYSKIERQERPATLSETVAICRVLGCLLKDIEAGTEALVV